jgi:hypothetical protein
VKPADVEGAREAILALGERAAKHEMKHMTRWSTDSRPISLTRRLCNSVNFDELEEALRGGTSGA